MTDNEHTLLSLEFHDDRLEARDEILVRLEYKQKQINSCLQKHSKGQKALTSPLG